MMIKISLKKYSHLVRYLERQAEWLGLARNAGPVIATLFLSKFGSGDRLSADDVAKVTGYSRNYVSIILSQLEALGVANGEMDHTQTGRGRRRILYEIDTTMSSIASLGVKKTIDHLHESLGEIRNLRDLYNDNSGIGKLLESLEKETQEALATLTSSQVKTK
jgi:DNA-binding transcriptional regulator GbsR (MarR family)